MAAAAKLTTPHNQRMWNDSAAPEGGSGPSEPSPDAGRFVDLEQAVRELKDRPVAEHPEVFDRAHTDLREALSEIDEA